MEQQALSHYLDRVIQQILDRRRGFLPDRRMRVVITGDSSGGQVQAIQCLEALIQGGYGLELAFSHSAGAGAVSLRYRDWLHPHGSAAWVDQREPEHEERAFAGLFLPNLSTNSLAKLALCLRDNLACRWVAHSLGQQKPVIATLNEECRQGLEGKEQGYQGQLARYIRRVADYGVVFSGMTMPAQTRGAPPARHGGKPLITLGDIRDLTPGCELVVPAKGLITPAARDEIRRRRISLIYHP